MGNNNKNGHNNGNKREQEEKKQQLCIQPLRYAPAASHLTVTKLQYNYKGTYKHATQGQKVNIETTARNGGKRGYRN